MSKELIFFLYVFGMTYLFRHTNGLGDCFLKVRCMLGQQHAIEAITVMNEEGNYEENIIGRTELPVPEYAPWYTKLIDCFWCTSTWISGISIAFYQPIPWNMKLVVWFASVGFAGALYTILQNGEK